MSVAPSTEHCPSTDDLSAFTDGLADEAMTRHVETCAACQNVVATYLHIDRAVRAAAIPPPGLAERIGQAVRLNQHNEPTENTRWWMLPTVRLAAAVAVTAGALAMLVTALSREKDDTPPPIVVKPPVEAPAQSYARSQDDPESHTPVGAQTPRDGNGGNDRHAMTVNTVVPRQALPRMVRHVWTVGSASECASLLQRVLPKGRFAQDTEGGNTAFSVVIPDRKLQELVDQLDGEHWELLSPDMPQPSKSSQVAFADKDISYRLVLAEK